MWVIPIEWKKKKNDWGRTPLLVIFFFFRASDSSENVPVHHRCARGGSEGGIKGGEIMRAHTGCKEFWVCCHVGVFSPIYPLIVVVPRCRDATLTTGTRPPVTNDSRFQKRRRLVIAPQQPFWVVHNSELRNFKDAGWALSSGQIALSLSVSFSSRTE